MSSLKNNLTKYRILTLVFALAISSLMMGCNKATGTASAPTTDNKTATNTSPTSTASSHSEAIPGDPKSSLDTLLQGNDRYVNGSLQARDLSKTKLEELAKGQHPHTIIVTCSDSRVSPELLFDQSQGDIFVIRTAGNVLDKAAMGSIEYAAEHLHSPLIMVVGHEKCGAVTAATKDDPVGGSIQYVVNEIKPAVTRAKGLGGDLVAKSVDENVKLVVETLPGRSQIVSHLIKENKLKIVGGTYSLSSGKVNVVSNLEQSPSAVETKTESKTEKKG
ncbi:MAG: carbonic anhydrase [Acidobacteria bacterium]|nr:carbonic anhydrase [Acidobacteriota bacterium]